MSELDKLRQESADLARALAECRDVFGEFDSQAVTNPVCVPDYVREQVQKLRDENYALADALMDMVAQFFREVGNNVFEHACMSAEENAIGVLEDLGLAEAQNSKRCYKLRFDKLKERQP